MRCVRPGWLGALLVLARAAGVYNVAPAAAAFKFQPSIGVDSLMTAERRSGCARAPRRCAPLLGLVGLWVLGAGVGDAGAQAQPTSISLSPASIEVGECYRVSVGATASMTLDVKYTFNDGPEQTVVGWLYVRVTPFGTLDTEVCTDPLLAPGTYTITAMRNTLNTAWVGASASIVVTPVPVPVPDFGVFTVAPGSETVVRGGSASYTVSVEAVNGFDAAVTLSAGGVPAGVTASFSPGSLSSPYTGSSTLRLTVGSGASAGTSTVTVTGTGGGLDDAAAVDLTVWDFAITATPSSRTVVRGGRSTHIVRVVPENGFDAAVTLSAGGVPAGVTASFSPGSLSSPYTGSSTLRLTVGAGASLGTSTVTVTGTGGGRPGPRRCA